MKKLNLIFPSVFLLLLVSSTLLSTVYSEKSVDSNANVINKKNVSNSKLDTLE